MQKYNDDMKWSTPPQEITSAYLESCRLSVEDDTRFNKFKQDPNYTAILEGSSQEMANMFFTAIIKDPVCDAYFLHNLEHLRENDALGSPTLYDCGKYGLFSSGTLKYIWNCAVILKELDLQDGISVVEIGAGYGGMCKTFSVFNKFKNYALIDLKEPIELCSKYLRNFDSIYSKLKFYTPKTSSDVDLSCDLVIADSSIAECNYSMQKFYLENIILKAKKGFIIYNSLHLSEQNRFFFEMCNKLRANGYFVYNKILHNTGVVEMTFTKYSRL